MFHEVFGKDGPGGGASGSLGYPVRPTIPTEPSNLIIKQHRYGMLISGGTTCAHGGVGLH